MWLDASGADVPLIPIIGLSGLYVKMICKPFFLLVCLYLWAWVYVINKNIWLVIDLVSWLFTPLIWSRLKYLNNDWMGCNKILYRRFIVPRGWIQLTLWSPDISSSTTTRLTFVVLNEMSQQILDGLPWHTHVSLRSYEDFDHLILYSSPIIRSQFPSASAVLC